MAVLELRLFGAQIVPSFVSSLFTVSYRHVTSREKTIPEDGGNLDEFPFGKKVVGIIRNENSVNDRRPHENRIPSRTSRRGNIDIVLRNHIDVRIAQAL